MSIKKITTSFAGGVVTPEFWGQLTDAKFQTGVAVARNMIVLPHGPLTNRAGFKYVNTVKTVGKKPRLIPFTYSSDQTMVLEFGEYYIRFHTQGASLLSGVGAAYSGATAYVPGDLVTDAGSTYYCIANTTGNAPPNATYWYGLPSAFYEIPTPYAEGHLFDIHYVQSADVLTLVHPSYAPRELRRLGATKWVLSTINFVSDLAVPNAPTVAATVGTGTTQYDYVVTSVGTTGLEESAPSVPAGRALPAVTGMTNASSGILSFTSAHGMSNGDPIAITDALGMTQINGSFTVQVYSATQVYLQVLGVNLNTSTFPAYTGGAVAKIPGVLNNLLTTGNYNTITWTTTGATRYNVYKKSNGLYGYIGQTDALTFKDDNITANLGKTPPIVNNPFASAGYYPGAVSYYEQRRCFAGSVNEPQNIRATRSGTESNLSYSIPTRDDDSINFRVAAREANTIRHIVPLSSMVLLTASAEWRVTSVNTDALTPTSFNVKPQSFVGANNTQPVVVNNNILYCAARGGHVREMAFNSDAGGYITGDLSLRAPHLFDGLYAVDMAYAKAPYPIVWVVSSNGKLLGLTYVPEQQVGAWHYHDGTGFIESCCVVAEGTEDALYVTVQRVVGGVTTRFVERMASRAFATPADAFFVDAGATYSGAPATVISGLTHLEGQTVNILGDGAVFAPKVVSGGQITLEQPCSKVHVGLPITADVQTLPLAAQIDGGLGQGRLKNINRVWLRVVNSSGMLAGPNLDELVRFKQRTTEPYGTPPALVNDEIEIPLKPSWQSGGQVYVRQTDPLPLTITSLTAEAEVGG